MRRATVLILMALTVAACSLPPGLERRQDYSGRGVLERDVVVEPVRHDEFGNPILSGQGD